MTPTTTNICDVVIHKRFDREKKIAEKNKNVE